MKKLIVIALPILIYLIVSNYFSDEVKDSLDDDAESLNIDSNTFKPSSKQNQEEEKKAPFSNTTQESKKNDQEILTKEQEASKEERPLYLTIGALIRSHFISYKDQKVPEKIKEILQEKIGSPLNKRMSWYQGSIHYNEQVKYTFYLKYFECGKYDSKNSVALNYDNACYTLQGHLYFNDEQGFFQIQSSVKDLIWDQQNPYFNYTVQHTGIDIIDNDETRIVNMLIPLPSLTEKEHEHKLNAKFIQMSNDHSNSVEWGVEKNINWVEASESEGTIWDKAFSTVRDTQEYFKAQIDLDD